MGLDWVTGAGKLVGVGLIALVGSCLGTALAMWRASRKRATCPTCKETACDLVFRCPRCRLFRDADA